MLSFPAVRFSNDGVLAGRYAEAPIAPIPMVVARSFLLNSLREMVIFRLLAVNSIKKYVFCQLNITMTRNPFEKGFLDFLKLFTSKYFWGFWEQHAAHLFI
jgi:hypothetical protein